jgi:hypothetical protein
MSPMHDEGSGSTPGPGADSSAGVQSHSYRMSLRASGWESPIGWTTHLEIRRVTHRQDDDEGKVLIWDCLTIPELKLSKAAALLVVQGLSLGRLFPPDLVFCVGDGTHPFLSYAAPVLLLKRDVPSAVEGPKLRNVVLGVVFQSMGYPEDELRSLMVAHVLSP